MISDYRKIEDHYVQNFSQREDSADYIRFYDDRLPGMYAFNCFLVKESMDENKVVEFVLDSLHKAKLANKEFLKILLHPKINVDDYLKAKFIENGFEVKTNLYMRLGLENLNEFESNSDCVVKKARMDTDFNQVASLDIKTCVESGIPEDFANKKSVRKMAVYKSSDKNLNAYIASMGKVAVGKCELFLDNGYAKIEDFDVAHDYQRKGIGTSMLKMMVKDARELGAENIYLIADKDDTPKEMYLKFGFKIIGEESELWKSLQ